MAIRIPSGTTDQYIYFVALDSTDFTSRETGFSSFTVYRSRNGGASSVMTTPTINETDITNMPGVYELLLDEDMTLTSGNVSEEMSFHITHAGMAPVTRTIELYQPDITIIPGEAIVAHTTTGRARAVTLVNGILTDPTGTASVGTAPFDYGIFVKGTSTEVTTDAGLTVVYTSTGNVDIVVDFTAGAAEYVNGARFEVRAKAGTLGGLSIIGIPLASFNLTTYADVATIADAVWDELQSGHVIAGSFGLYLDSVVSLIPTAAVIADSVWDEAQSAHITVGSFGVYAADALIATHLDHLLAVDYNPASKPGVATALLNELVESDGGVSRYTVNALEQAPSGGGGTAAAVWAYATRTLTQTAAAIAATLTGTTISIQRGDTLSIAFTGLGDITDYSSLWFTIKPTLGDLIDAAATLQISLTLGTNGVDGIVYIEGTAPTDVANGSITLDDVAAGDITIALSALETAKLVINSSAEYDVQILRTGGNVTTLTRGSCSIVDDVTRDTN